MITIKINLKLKLISIFFLFFTKNIRKKTPNRTNDKFKTKVPIKVDKILKYIKKTNIGNKYGNSYLLFDINKLLILDLIILYIKNDT